MAFIYIFFSLIGDFGHPVGRHGEGRDRGNTAKRSVNKTPIWGADTFLGGGSNPLEKEGVG